VAELLRTEGLTKRFQGLLANDSIDFRLSSGELRCVIGPNGAGKTTFISMISGHLRATAGAIWYRGEQITQLPVPARAKRGIGRKFQTPSVFDNQSVLENVELAVLAAARRPSHVHARIAQVLELVRLEDQAEILARNLSHGQRQWLEIGLLLANDAKLLLLDEPTAGMTAEETVATSQLVRRLIAELDVAAIIIEHDINFIRGLRAPITVLHLGRVLVEGSFDEIARDPEVREVYLGGSEQ
jgi:urea ABC transporter ATP-binding protein UrtD